MVSPTPPLKSLKSLDLAGVLLAWLFASIPSTLATTVNAASLPNHRELSSSHRFSQQLIAGADNFNPDLYKPPLQQNLQPQIPLPPPPTNTNPSVDPGKPSADVAKNFSPFAVLEELKPDLRTDWNNSGQVNRTIENTAIFRLNNGDRATIKTGYDTYEQPGAKTVTNIPVQIGWETKINSLKIQPGVGVDILDGATIPNLNLKVDYPISTGLTVSADVQQGAYKFNAKTIDNKISALRYGPSIFWNIDPNTSLFSSLHFGNYNDGNVESQSFTRLERKFGEFSLAGNLFNWGYKNPTDKGYFAPADFLVYTGEIAWEGDVISNLLKCRLSAPLGGQRVNGVTSDAGGYQGKCTAKFSPNFEADLGYSFSNVKNQATGLSTANSQSLGTQVRIKF